MTPPHEHDRHDHAGHGRIRALLVEELTSHLPFSVSSVAIGLVLAGVICVVTVQAGTTTEPLRAAAAGPEHPFLTPLPRALFHLFHPAHMLFSAAATTAMFWRYDRRVVRAVLVGLAGAIVVCGLSDIAIPALAPWMLPTRYDWPWHICIIDHAPLVIPFAVVGVSLGLCAAVGVQKSTFFSHSLHVFASTMASIFYLVGRFATPVEWIDEQVGMVFLVTIFAVMVPCCLSDIVFPVLMSRSARAQCFADGHHH